MVVTFDEHRSHTADTFGIKRNDVLEGNSEIT
jgi:hypothetical protein